MGNTTNIELSALSYDSEQNRLDCASMYEILKDGPMTANAIAGVMGLDVDDVFDFANENDGLFVCQGCRASVDLIISIRQVEKLDPARRQMLMHPQVLGEVGWNGVDSAFAQCALQWLSSKSSAMTLEFNRGEGWEVTVDEVGGNSFACLGNRSIDGALCVAVERAADYLGIKLNQKAVRKRPTKRATKKPVKKAKR